MTADVWPLSSSALQAVQSDAPKTLEYTRAEAQAARVLQQWALRWRRQRQHRLSVHDCIERLNGLQSLANEEQLTNPTSHLYVGAVEHRRRVERLHGKFKTFGSPTKNAMEHAFPAQVATMLNVLRVVDALNSLVRERIVQPQADGVSVMYDELVRWEDAALQARFSGVVQYTRSARRFGFLRFDGELPQGTVLTLCKPRADREELLHCALEHLEMVVPGGNFEETRARLMGAQCQAQVRDFLAGSFYADFPHVRLA